MRRRSTCPVSRSVSILFVTILAVVACEPEKPAEIVPESAVQQDREVRQPPQPVGEDPFENFDIPAVGEQDRPLVRHELRIENGLAHVIVVAATAGAAPVVLDSLDPGEFVRLDVEAPADRLELQWHTIDGSASGTRLVEAMADSVQVVRFEVVPGPR
jgi:hypothetical protein